MQANWSTGVTGFQVAQGGTKKPANRHRSAFQGLGRPRFVGSKRGCRSPLLYAPSEKSLNLVQGLALHLSGCQARFRYEKPVRPSGKTGDQLRLAECVCELRTRYSPA
jgi:hypothetical protein